MPSASALSGWSSMQADVVIHFGAPPAQLAIAHSPSYSPIALIGFRLLEAVSCAEG